MLIYVVMSRIAYDRSDRTFPCLQVMFKNPVATNLIHVSWYTCSTYSYLGDRCDYSVPISVSESPLEADPGGLGHSSLRQDKVLEGASSAASCGPV